MKRRRRLPLVRKRISRDDWPSAPAVAATDLHNPDFAKMAKAAGLLGLTAETPEQVRPMIAQALQHDGPALVEVRVSRQELSMPPTITLEQMTGFSLFMLKAVLSGRGDEIVDLAKVNLLRRWLS